MNATIGEWLLTALATVGVLAAIVIMCSIAIGIASWITVEITRAWHRTGVLMKKK